MDNIYFFCIYAKENLHYRKKLNNQNRNKEIHCRAINMSASRFPSFLGPLECSQSPSSCSIFFHLLSGFYRVVKHICRLIQTQLVAVFRGQGKTWKIKNNRPKSTFQGSWKIFLAIHSLIILINFVLSRSFCY